MRRLLLAMVLAVSSGFAFADVPTVECAGCSSLRDFGNFGSAQLYRATGPISATVGNDRVWVINPKTGKRAFVDIDTPITLFYFMGAPIPVPDFTQTEINATWDDGSISATWLLPSEILEAMGQGIEIAEEVDTPEVTEEEFDQLPGFNDAYVWQFIGTQGGVGPVELLYNLWSFSSLYIGGTPVVTVYECAWSSAC